MTDPHEVNRLVAELLQKARAEAGMTQAELAAKAEISRATVANIEVGAQSVSVYQLLRLADALGVPPEHLLPEAATVSQDDNPESRRLYAAYETVLSAE
jgi:transcriptional regulator with XRE-family HTH domain